MIQTHQFSGKNLEDALSEAARYYSVDKAFVCYNILSNNQKGGFLSKIFSNKVQIEAWVETAKEDLQEAARKAVREALNSNHAKLEKPKFEKAPKNERRDSHVSRANNTDSFSNSVGLEYNAPEVKALLKKYNELFFSAFSLSAENYSTKLSENNLIVHVSDPFLEDMLTKSDKISLAYEHVFKRIAQKKLGDIAGRLTLDAGSSAEKREERLVQIAKSLAEKVRKTGRNIILSSKSNQERRIIHLALDGFEGIGTRSIGMGDKRRLVIFSTATSHTEKNTSKKPNNNKRKIDKNSSNKKKNTHPRTNEKLVNE